MLRRILQIGQMHAGGIVVVALHRRCRCRRARWPRPNGWCARTARRTRPTWPARACGAADIPPRRPRNWSRRAPRAPRPRRPRRGRPGLGIGFGGVVSSSGAASSGAAAALAEPGIRVLRHHPRHRHGALGQRGEAGRIDRAWTKRSAARLPDEHAQAEVAALRAFQMLGLARSRRCTLSEVPPTSTHPPHRPRRRARGRSGRQADQARPWPRAITPRQPVRDLPAARAQRPPDRAPRASARARNTPRRGAPHIGDRHRLDRAPLSPAVGITRPNTCICRASCSQRLPVLSSDISRPGLHLCARPRQFDLRHVRLHLAAARPA